MSNEHVAKDFKDHQGNDIGGGGGGGSRLIPIPGFYHGPGWLDEGGGASYNTTIPGGKQAFIGVFLNTTYDRVAIQINTGSKGDGSGPAPPGNELRLGLYDSAVGGGPGALLDDLGLMATDAAGVQENVISINRVGEFWIGLLNEASVGLRAHQALKAGNGSRDFFVSDAPIVLGTEGITGAFNAESARMVLATQAFGALPDPAPTVFDTTLNQTEPAFGILFRKT